MAGNPFITEEEERLSILAALPTDLHDPYLRALMWFGDIEAVRLAADTMHRTRTAYHEYRTQATQIIYYWMQRTFPLPDFDILDMQWKMQLVLAASCAGLANVNRAAAIPNVDGTGLGGALQFGDVIPHDLVEPLGLEELQRRLRGLAPQQS
ncbi:hypothetical protein KEM56_001343 [Ascosphaera pollenicola]|nr:hypothetical protein KEM56_001343 [Ascosphaera pollenicola]